MGLFQTLIAILSLQFLNRRLYVTRSSSSMLPGDNPRGEGEADPKKLFLVPDSFRGIFGMDILSDDVTSRRPSGAKNIVSSSDRLGPSALSTASFTPPLLFKSREVRGRSSAPALTGACCRLPLDMEREAGVEPGRRYSTVSCLYKSSPCFRQRT